MLSGEERNKLSSADSKIDDAIKAEMEKCREEIINKMTMIMEAESLTKEFIKKTFDEIRELVDNFEKLALERCNKCISDEDIVDCMLYICRKR